MRKRIFSLILAAVLLSIPVLSVSAHEVPDLTRRGSVAISMSYRGQPIPGGTLTVLRVAEVKSDFAECGIPAEEPESAELARELARMAGEKGLTGTTAAVDAGGRAKFEDLELGLYLVVQNEAAEGFKKINPFLVSVPLQEEGRYIYDVDTAPKNLPEPETKPTEPTPPPPPDLPQTGQTNWPIPVLTVAGLALVMAGLCLCLGEKRKDHEA